ncbi:type II secretion system protein [Ruficoccus amylovorans]|uniref:Type II secretion system protein n=1 Tax=Ruficoccus amylovorans TaxID=1804625 RepID=A0A842HHW9_9BACT|nr:type II secretion system protein [Ruficoccus amylovorans]MBC2596002.1 type II secretion system protein [Ruficoccus amylovorans]
MLITPFNKSASTSLSQRAGFTLIELLCVIAVIAILASLLMVGTNAVRRMADNTETTSRLRQCGIGMFNYAADHHGNVPSNGLIGADGTDRSGPGRRWPDKVAPYMGLNPPYLIANKDWKTYQPYRCVSQDDFIEQQNLTGPNAVFGLNEYFSLEYEGVPGEKGWRKFSDAIDPATTPLLVTLSAYDENGSLIGSGHVANPRGGPSPLARKYGWSQRTNGTGPAPTLNGAYGILYIDGHVGVVSNSWPFSAINAGMDFHPKKDVSITPAE